jgi:Domain of unknown function (DUF3846)
MKGISFTINETGDHIVVDFWQGDGLSDLQAAVGGYIEAAPSADCVTIWCNEDGKGLGLPINGPANTVWAMYDEFDCLSWDRLVGNVVITGGTDEVGETMDLPFEEYQRIIELLQDDAS